MEPLSAHDLEIPDYDRLWREVYGDIQDVGPVHRHMKRLLRRMLAPLEYSSVLDVGCGLGHNLPLITEGRRLDAVGGIDFSPEALRHVRGRWGDDFHLLDVEREHLDRTYDLVFASLLLEHVRDDALVLRNLRAMTERHLVVVTIAGEFERYLPWEKQMGHLRNYARGELEGKLRDAGFAVDEVLYWGFPLYTPVVRTLQNRMTASSEFGPATRLVARITHALYFLNSSRRGDLLIARAHPV